MEAKQTKQVKSKQSPVVNKARAYAVSLRKQEYTDATIVGATTRKFPALKRGELLAIAADLGIGTSNASGRYWEVRSGRSQPEMP